MKLPGPVESRRLVALLEDALHRETRLWKVPVYKNGLIQGTDTSSTQHGEVIRWLGEMSRLFHFCPETFALGVCVLHRMLSTVKAQPKYLKCIAFTSLLLAAKTNEEDEVPLFENNIYFPPRMQLFHSGDSSDGADHSGQAALDLYTATPVDFIHIVSHCSHRQQNGLEPSGLQVALWTRQVQHCMACHQLWQFKGSTLALAIITLELEALTPDWFSVCTDLMKKGQVDSAEFIHCRETVDEYLHSLEFSLSTNAVYIVDGAQIQSERDRTTLRPSRRGRGQREQGEVDEYYDGFRCLYSEEMMPESHKSVSPCPPLHPAVN
uniref:Cyclin I family, member 2 n=1 Tax=Neogobius melanostomus TaxID=47308 RepID=A0A8C6WFM1_9GOBI